MTDPFAFAGLVESHYGSHRPRMAEPAGNIDRRLRVARLDTEYRQTGICQSFEQPLRLPGPPVPS
ncbi:hypothetical protein FHX09_002763 [Rhizobium sp. BK538]|nr:hypothetical protein [Rhizobium sp. BK060]MBB4168917.1 hypothetical protein [Rhizobium sp. BK538]TCM75219.1 hypothetical protein EV291_115137 [Rhizobium sp. BK068]